MKKIYFYNIKKFIDKLDSTILYWDCIRRYLSDKEYSDHTLHLAQVYAEQKYYELEKKGQ